MHQTLEPGSVLCTLYSVLLCSCILYSCTLYSVLCTLYSVLCTLCSVLCTLYSFTLVLSVLYFNTICTLYSVTLRGDDIFLPVCSVSCTIHLQLFTNYDILKENRIYIRGEFTRKKCKTAILLYCFHTAGVLHIFMLYNLLGPGI